MKKSLAIAVVAAFIMTAGASAMAANSSSSDNKVVAAGKKVWSGVCWPFKKAGEGMKAGYHKITGK